MFDPIAKKRFLDQSLDSWEWLKEIKREDLESIISEGNPEYKFKTRPFFHQLVAIVAGLSNDGFLFLLDMGLGKTKVVLDLISILKPDTTLVVCPTSVVNVWTEEAEKHSYLVTRELLGSKWERKDILEEEADIYIINYQGLQSLMTETKKGKRKPIDKLIQNFISRFDAVVFDESSFLKNPKSLTFKLANKLADQCSLRYGLTGTPMSRDPIDLWSQFYTMDRGKTLTPNYFFFRDVFFTPKDNYWGGVDWKINSELEPILHEKMKNTSIRYRVDEAIDLPEVIYQKIQLDFSKEAADYYLQCEEGLVKEVRGLIEVKNAFVRTRMCCSGFLQYLDEDDDKKTIVFSQNPKLDALQEILEETDDKVVVFHDFVMSGKLIEQRLMKLKIRFSCLNGSTINKEAAIGSFRKDMRCKVFIVNSASGGFGLNLQEARIVVFFESPLSNIVRKQAEKRVHRTGQLHKVIVYDLIMKESIEVKILGYIEEGEDAFQKIIEGRTKWKRKEKKPKSKKLTKL